MRPRLKRIARRLVERTGYTIRLTESRWPSDFTQSDIDLVEAASPYSMTTPSALVTLADAVRHVLSSRIPGDIVECGVWRGGSMMTVARTLIAEGREDVGLHLMDTFEGMPPPTNRDVHWTGKPAHSLLAGETDEESSMLWARASLNDVAQAMDLTGYPSSMVHYVKGRVENTIPAHAPEQIALLRLDTDWYESTKHELTHLYPRLSPGGILIVDDYGWWRGQREATDEYFQANPPRPFLVRVDDGGAHMAVKQAEASPGQGTHRAPAAD